MECFQVSCFGTVLLGVRSCPKKINPPFFCPPCPLSHLGGWHFVTISELSKNKKNVSCICRTQCDVWGCFEWMNIHLAHELGLQLFLRQSSQFTNSCCLCLLLVKFRAVATQRTACHGHSHTKVLECFRILEYVRTWEGGTKGRGEKTGGRGKRRCDCL